MTLEKLLLLPVVLHFFMTVALGVVMGRARFAAVAGGRAKLSEVVLNSRAWPSDVLKISNNFDNQFQIPMLWYALVAFSLLTGTVDSVLVVLSWVFAASRLVHTIIHTGGNKLPQRFYAYLVGITVLTLMWAWFSARYFVIG